MEQKANSFSFESGDLIMFFIKHFKTLAIITTLGAIVSIVVALTIPVRFKSTAVVFPTSSSSISNDLLSNNLGRKDILKFGSEEEVEQMLQVLQSDVIRDAIIRDFNLMEHYEIKPEGAYPLTNLHKQFSKNIQFRRTEYMSVVIDVYDTDKELAAEIANRITDLFDTAMTRMKSERALIALKLVEKEYHQSINDLKTMEDSLRKIQMLGINNYESQSEVYNDAYAQAILKGQTAQIKQLEAKIAILSEYGAQYSTLRNMLIYETERQSKLKSKYTEAKIDYEQSLPHKFIIDKAVVAEKKSKPVRWLIVSLSTLSTFVFAFLGLILYDGLGSKLKAFTRQQSE